MDLIQRLFFILTTIQQSPGITAPELANLAGTSVRSIYRDIRRLDDCGIQIMREGNKGYYLIDKYVQTPGKLGTEEYLAISLYPILSGQTKLKGHPFQRSFQSAMDKILTRFQVNDQLLQISKRIRIHTEQSNPEQDLIIQRIIEAIIQEVTITCEYYTMYRDDLTRRMIDPYYLVPRGGYLYLIGYCHEREEIRTFRLNRFRSIALTNKKFFIEDDFDIDRYLDKVWGIKAETDEVTFKVRFSSKVARYIKEHHYDSPPQFIDEQDGSLLLIVTTRGAEEFLRWMKQYGNDAELVEPQEYRMQLLEEYRELARTYSETVHV
ncbi:transcriptional regulator [Brevibacillus sp. LEMMJ03]|uniref:helix-turn-helix transcriptional regulator n=1 Tax=Brevibacillus sp. LEMMJ03 TaxID=2595056 RepID=UPI0011804911|nr:transcriptional regulator [Brevibacillus sp. LEMMJ03]TRY24795.1 transcriptional regulator [Brevibacillus sp. LEMMJ03]